MFNNAQSEEDLHKSFAVHTQKRSRRKAHWQRTAPPEPVFTIPSLMKQMNEKSVTQLQQYVSILNDFYVFTKNNLITKIII